MQDYVPDPAAEAKWVVNGFFCALAADLPDTQRIRFQKAPAYDGRA